ncbi:MAG TPA: hypothetical protein VLE23_08125 [Geminicoccaceae bacterium]|nr:hypothetical protein [Geminicoccaceae bacterium]
MKNRKRRKPLAAAAAWSPSAQLSASASPRFPAFVASGRMANLESAGVGRNQSGGR